MCSRGGTIDVLRDEVRTWLLEAWSPEITVREWWRRLADAGLSRPTWPAPYGRGLSSPEARVVIEELAAIGAIAPPDGAIGTTLAAPTLLAHGTPDQLERYLPPLLRGEESWCQLFSEPGSGSDLASLGARALRDDDGWIVNGQKVWNSSAGIAQRAILLARTNVDAPKARGITFFVLDMDQPGVDARPLRTMNGESRFCEVFLTDVHIGRADVIGDVDDGWRVARTTLAHERASVASRPGRGLVYVPSGPIAGHLDRTAGEVVHAQAADPSARHRNAVPARELIALARERGRSADVVVRQRLARYYSLTEINRISQLRIRAAVAAGRSPGPEGSVTKLAIARICHTSREVTFSILGADTMLWGSDAPAAGELHAIALASFGTSIGGGTDEIQRNLLGERALGLPREPSLDRDVPYRDLRVGTQG